MWRQETPDRWVADGAWVYQTVNVPGWVVALHTDNAPTRWIMENEREGVFRRFTSARAAMRAAERVTR